MTRVGRIGRWIAVLLLPVLVAAALTWLLVTTSGLRLALGAAGPFVPGKLDFGRVEGSIVGPIHLADLEVEIASLRVSARSADIVWHPIGLLNGEIAIESLRLEGADVVRLPGAAASATPFELPAAIAPPLGVTIDTVAVTTLRVRSGVDAAPLVLDRAAFGFRWSASELALRDLALEGPQLSVRGELRVAPRGDYAASGALDWSYAPTGYPPLHGVTTLSGSMNRLDVVQRLDAPYGVDARFSVSAPLTRPTLEGTAALQTAAAQLLAGQLVESISGNLRIAGPIDAVDVAGDLNLRAASSADVTVNLVSRYEGNALAVESLRLADPATKATLELAGNIGLAAPLTIDLTGQWSSLQWPLRGAPLASSPSGSVQLSGTPRELRADLNADVSRGSVRGTVQWTDDMLDAHLDWQGLSYPQSAPTLISRRGTLSVEGRPDAYRLNADIDLLAVRETVSGHIRMDGQGTRDALEIEHVDIGTLNGAVQGHASVGWRPAFNLAAVLDFDELDPAVLLDRWPGRIKGRADVALASDAGKLSGEAKALELTGTLRDRPLKLSARGRWLGGAAGTFDHLDLQIGETSLHARGTVGPTNDVSWDLASPSLADLSPDLAGRLSTKGQLTGAWPLPTIDAEADGAEVAIGPARIGSVALRGKVDARGAAPSVVDLTLGESRVAGHDLAQLTLHASGTAADHAITARGTVDGVQASLDLTGAVEHVGQPDAEWSFRLEDASAQYPMFAPWTLRAPATGRWTAATAVLDEACWQSLGASLCFDGSYARDEVTAQYRLTALPLQYFAYYLPVGTAVEGTASASGSFTLASGALPLLSMQLMTSSIWAGPDNASDREGGLAFAPGSVTAEWDAQRLTLDVSLPLEAENGGITLQAAATRGSGDAFGRSALTGVVRAEFGDLRFLSEILRGVGDTAGHLSADIQLRGTLDRPEFLGQATLANGAARLVDPGILLENTSAVLTADGSGTFGFEAAASSGGGDLRAVGSLRFDQGAPVGHIAITGADFAFLDLPTIRAYASPNLEFDLKQDRADVTGRVVVPRATITLRDSNQDIVRVSPDQVLVDAEGPQRGSLMRPLYARIGLELGDGVTFDGLGLKGRLEGALQINEVPGEPATGSGELRIVKGTYEAYQQELEIRTGKLLFAGGALSRPGLDIEAVRRPGDDILVGARIRGTLDRPELTLFSEPSMARQEQLSYLVLGRPLERTSSSETSALSQAALMLGLSGSDILSDRINRSLGFEEFGIQTRQDKAGEKQTASFVIGRYLAPSLYISYGIGLFQQANTLRLRYRITDRWRLETESSSESAGGDVIYHVERGK